MKGQVRKRIRQIVSAMSPAIARIKSQAACAAVANLPEFRQAQVVMVYIPMPAEADCSAVAKAAWQAGKTVLAPKVTWSPREMIAVKVGSLTEGVTVGEYGVPTPPGEQPWPLETIDLIVVPALAFDRRGHRLGRGAGFYDRFLAHGLLRAAVCGLSFAEQLVDRLPNHAHDRPVQILATDREVLRFSPAAQAARRLP